MLDLIQGQPRAIRYLQAIVEGQLTRPLILAGPDGTGKRTAVTLAFRLLVCQGDRTRQCPCVDCAQIQAGLHPDFVVLRAGDQGVGVDEIREVLEGTWIAPSQGPFRAVVIDGADRLTPAAANALLKSLEEPPSYVRYFLLAQSFEGILSTIRSRCVEVFFLPLPAPFVQSVLSQHESNEKKALVLGRLSEGSVGRAVQLWGAGRLTLRDKVLETLKVSTAGDLRAAFSRVDALEKDWDLALDFLDLLVHDLMIFSLCPDRCCNLDRMADLQALAGKAPKAGWGMFWGTLRDFHGLRRGTRVQEAFHLKSILAETFVGV